MGRAAEAERNVLSTRKKRTPRVSGFVYALISFLFFFGGLSSLFIGFVLILFHTLIPGDLTFNRIGTILLILGIPMILFSSFFIDKFGEHRD